MKYIFLVILCCFIWTANAQEYLRLMRDPGATLEETVVEAEKYFNQAGHGRGSGYKQFKRWEYFAKRGLDARGKIITNTAAYQALQKFKRQEKTALKSTTNSWIEMGPKSAINTSTWSSHLGRVSSIGLDPNNSEHLIVGSPGGGVWKTVDGGSSWTPIFDSEAILDVYSLAISPANSNHYYCGTSGLGMLRSTDGGVTWTPTTGIPSGALLIRIIIDPVSPGTLMAINQWGNIYRSSDAGNNWITVHTGVRLYDLEFKPGNSNIVYASGEGIILKSTDNGVSFLPLVGPWGIDAIMIGVTQADPDYLYALEDEDGGFKALYRSTDSGNSWSTRSDNSTGDNNIMGYELNEPGGQAPRDMDVVVSPTDKTEVHVAGITTYRSNNSGTTWTRTSDWTVGNPIGFIHADCDLMFYRGSTIYFGTDGGLFTSTDQASTFTDKSTGLGIRQFYRIGVSRLVPDRVSGGSQDNGTGLVKNGQWYDFLGADGMETFIDHTNNDVIYGTVQFGSLYRSTDGGISYAGIGVPGGQGNWVTPLEQDPNLSSNLYIAKSQVYKTMDGGFSWQPISSFGLGNADELKIAPSDYRVMYVSFSQNVFKTENGGESWVNVTPVSPGFSQVNYIAIHPENPQRLSLTLSGSAAKCIESLDGGVTWNNITANLPNLSAQCVVYEGSLEDGMYVGMDPGIYYKDASSTNWSAYMTELPNVMVTEIEINRATSQLYAATYGRGLWKTNMMNPLPNGCLNNITLGGHLPDNTGPFEINANQQIIATLDVGLNNQLLFRSEGQISLESGFEIYPGSILDLLIEACPE